MEYKNNVGVIYYFNIKLGGPTARNKSAVRCLYEGWTPQTPWAFAIQNSKLNSSILEKYSILLLLKLITDLRFLNIDELSWDPR